VHKKVSVDTASSVTSTAVSFYDLTRTQPRVFSFLISVVEVAHRTDEAISRCALSR
jgi:hypothetical protein